MKKLLLLVNPVTAKRTLGSHMIDVIDCFMKGGFEVTVHVTQRKGETSEVAKNRGEEFDTIVCVGGDGTLNDTVSGILSLKNKPKLGYIPAGTTNDFASSWDIPKKPLEAAKKIINTKPRKTDVCLFGDKPYVYVAAFGAFTEVSYSTPQPLKNALGRTAYIFEGVTNIGSIKPWEMTVEHDGGIISGEFLYGMIANTKSVGGFELKMKDEISISDGLMELILVRKPQKAFDTTKMIAAVLKQDTKSEYITYVHTKEVKITTKKPMPWTVDGEFGGRVKKVKSKIIHHAIEMYI